MPLALTEQEFKQAERDAVVEYPLFLVEDNFLTIKTKAGDMVKLQLNTVQRKVLNKIKQLLAKGKPIRLWLLKARQAGISTLIEAIIYAFTSQSRATNALVVSNDIDGANYIFSMQKLFQEQLEQHLKPQIKHSNEKKLEFESIHSQILIDTSDNLKAGRSYTFRLVHLSETAFYRDLRTLMIGLNQSVPNLSGTMIIGETTANGMGNQFYDEWVACVNGMSDWEYLFIAWFEIEEYTMPLQGGMYPIEAIEFVNAIDRDKFLNEERDLKQKYTLTDEQLNWRRWCIVNNCNRKVEVFNQEYPDCWETAFIATGDLFFNKNALKEQKIEKPLFVGNIVKEDGRYKLRVDSTGLFKIYDLPKRGEQYIVAGDAAEGLPHGDKCAAVVLNKRTNNTVCVYNHNIPPDRFEEDLIKMGNYYNEATVVCENKGYGFSVNQGLYRKYGKVYRKIKHKKGFDEPTLELGWNTNSATRPQMLAQLAEEIQDESTDLLDNELIQQCWTFINNPKKVRPEAEQGKCDDLVMARAIAGQVRQEQPYKDMFRRLKRKVYKGLAGY